MAGHRPASSKPDPTTVANVEDPSIAAPLPEDEVLTSYDDQTGDWTAPSGGSSGPLGAAFYGGSTTMLANDGQTDLPWVLDRGTDLLDTTDPLRPVARAAGIYTVCATFYGFPVSAGKYVRCVIDLDLDNLDAYTSQIFALDGAGAGDYGGNTFNITTSFFVPEGGTFEISTVTNDTVDMPSSHYSTVTFVPGSLP